MNPITFSQFKKLQWLKTDSNTMRIFILPSRTELQSCIRPHNPNVDDMTKLELFNFIKDNLQDYYITLRYDGLDVIDMTLETNTDLLNFFVYLYNSTDNTIILTSSLLQ